VFSCLFKFKCQKRRNLVDQVVNAIDDLFALNQAGFRDFSLVEFSTLLEKDSTVWFDAEILGVVKIASNFTMDFGGFAANSQGFARALFENVMRAGDAAINSDRTNVVKALGDKIKNAVCQQFLKRNC
jgi:hypothetical protein